MTETAPKLIKPHCGTQPLAPRKDKYGDWHMECRKCGGATIGGTHRATVSRWNDGQFNHRRPNPETQAVATERLDLGNLRVIVECMTCTGKLPHGCPNCKGLDFCVKRHAQKTLDKLEAYRDKQK